MGEFWEPDNKFGGSQIPLISTAALMKKIIGGPSVHSDKDIKGTLSIPQTYLSSSVAWGLNLRAG